MYLFKIWGELLLQVVSIRQRDSTAAYFDNVTLRFQPLSGAFHSAIEGRFTCKIPFDCAMLRTAWLRSGATWIEQMFNVTLSNYSTTKYWEVTN
jgi:hypothetical protein